MTDPQYPNADAYAYAQSSPGVSRSSDAKRETMYNAHVAGQETVSGRLAEALADVARLKVERDLATHYLRSICDKAEDGGKCLLCGEDFADSTPRSFPECSVPAARDFLKDPKSQVDAVLRAGDLPDESSVTEATQLATEEIEQPEPAEGPHNMGCMHDSPNLAGISTVDGLTRETYWCPRCGALTDPEIDARLVDLRRWLLPNKVTETSQSATREDGS